MQAFITSYLIQKKECNLPLLGHFRIKTKPTELDRAGKQIFPPTDEILYSEFPNNLSPDLITHISNLQKITRDEAENKIHSWCHHAKEKLDEGEKIIFTSIGSLQKNAVGNVFFQRKKGISFYEPVSAERLHKNAEHSVLVGDIETTSGIMNEFYSEEIAAKKTWWKIWAIGLLAISLLVLVIYFYTHEFSEAAIGTRASFHISGPPAMYYFPAP